MLPNGTHVTYRTSSGIGSNALTVEVLAYVPSGTRLAPPYGPHAAIPKGVSHCSHFDRYVVRVLQKNGQPTRSVLKFPVASTLDNASDGYGHDAKEPSHDLEQS